MHDIADDIRPYIPEFVQQNWQYILLAYLMVLLILSVRFFVIMRQVGAPIWRILVDIALFSVWWPPYLLTGKVKKPS